MLIEDNPTQHEQEKRGISDRVAKHKARRGLTDWAWYFGVTRSERDRLLQTPIGELTKKDSESNRRLGKLRRRLEKMSDTDKAQIAERARAYNNAQSEEERRALVRLEGDRELAKQFDEGVSRSAIEWQGTEKDTEAAEVRRGREREQQQARLKMARSGMSLLDQLVSYVNGFR